MVFSYHEPSHCSSTRHFSTLLYSNCYMYTVEQLVTTTCHAHTLVKSCVCVGKPPCFCHLGLIQTPNIDIGDVGKDNKMHKEDGCKLQVVQSGTNLTSISISFVVTFT